MEASWGCTLNKEKALCFLTLSGSANGCVADVITVCGQISSVGIPLKLDQ